MNWRWPSNINIWSYATFWCDAARSRKSQYQLVFLDKWAPYFDYLKPLGLRCSVVCVMWCSVGGGLVKVCIFHNKKMHVYLLAIRILGWHARKKLEQTLRKLFYLWLWPQEFGFLYDLVPHCFSLGSTSLYHRVAIDANQWSVTLFQVSKIKFARDRVAGQATMKQDYDGQELNSSTTMNFLLSRNYQGSRSNRKI